MGFMVGPKGRVVGVEHIPELIEIATKNIQADCPHLLRDGRVKFVGEILSQGLIALLCHSVVHFLPIYRICIKVYNQFYVSFFLPIFTWLGMKI